MFAGGPVRQHPRPGSAPSRSCWAGRVGVVTAVCRVPVLWVPIVAAIGAVLGHGHRFVGDDSTGRIRVAYA